MAKRGFTLRTFWPLAFDHEINPDLRPVLKQFPILLKCKKYCQQLFNEDEDSMSISNDCDVTNLTS